MLNVKNLTIYRSQSESLYHLLDIAETWPGRSENLTLIRINCITFETHLGFQIRHYLYVSVFLTIGWENLLHIFKIVFDCQSI